MATYLLSDKLYKKDEQDMRGTTREVGTNVLVAFFYGPLPLDFLVFGDQKRLTSVQCRGRMQPEAMDDR